MEAMGQILDNPALQPSPSQPAPMSATEGEGFSFSPVAIVSWVQLIDKESPANSKEILEFTFGLLGQFSWAAGWGRVDKGKKSSLKKESP